jgi:hypothetical protein
VAHRDCGPLARHRLEAKEVELPDQLPELLVDEDIGELPALHLPPAGYCPFCGSAETTAEHVVPKWVSRDLNKLASLHVTTEHGLRRLQSIEMTAPICPACNNRWL